MNVMKMMKQAQELQEKAQKIQVELASRRYEAVTGGVTVVSTGDGMIVSLKIEPSIVKEGAAEMLEDLIVTAVREATEKGKKDAAQEMNKLTSSMGLPGMA